MNSTLLSKAEKSYIQAGLQSTPPSRGDGRGLADYRAIALETGVAPLANGSARVSIGRSPHDGAGGTEVLAASKLEVESVEPGSAGVEGGRVSCSVTCSPAAYPHLTSSALDDLQHDLTALLHESLSHPSLHPRNLGILRGTKHAKAWVLHLDAVVLVDSGNVCDALFMAARAALCDTRVPRTRSVEYKARRNAGAAAAGGGGGVVGASAAAKGQGDMDVDEEAVSGFDTRQIQSATDFELPDYWDEGEPLDGRDRWPICVTLNVVSNVHFLDASTQEESATPLRLLLLFAFESTQSVKLQGMRTLGSSELTSSQLADLLKAGEKYAREIWQSLNAKLTEESLAKIKERNKF
ncbi:Exosome complex component RRP42 [Psilocybe cubensis]|uniref:Exosome complex component RRP42 n=2 Tax=Psilocybe cubensis TaxID=181762 RepID=A0ACB8GNR3_PSICU|nr:Exosome complex component RRP42 [Psilocybe cubensis]KAH9477012.1 Exosome complex component RRP42 [Psilocybe cubensis]